jgi:glycosyltransferase involved in cell wall biosynthesis
MNILIPILGFAKAGGYRVLSNLANEWVQLGHKVDFLVPETSMAPYFPTDAGIITANRSGQTITQQTEFGKRSISALDNLLSLYAGVKAIGDNYDVVLANHSFTPWAVWLAKTRKPKLFYYIQAYEPEYYQLENRWVSWLLAKLSYRLPFTRIVNSPIYLDYKGIQAIGVIPPGLDLKIYHPNSRQKNLQSAKEVIVGTIGRLEPAKGTIYALKGFAAAHAQDKRIHLKVAYGNLPEKWSHPSCSTVIPKNDKELADYYRSLDILLAPCTTQHGAAHYPVMEAMGCGAAVISTGYMPASEENSWIAENRSCESVAAKILDVISDTTYQKKLDLAATDISKFDWPAVAKNMLDLMVTPSTGDRSEACK